MSAKAERSRPPAHLSNQMQTWWAEVADEHALEGHHRHLLQLACEAFDRAEDARRAIEVEGATHKDRFGQVKAHPVATIERDSRRDFAAIVRQLNFDEEAPQ